MPLSINTKSCIHTPYICRIFGITSVCVSLLIGCGSEEESQSTDMDNLQDAEISENNAQSVASAVFNSASSLVTLSDSGESNPIGFQGERVVPSRSLTLNGDCSPSGTAEIFFDDADDSGLIPPLTTGDSRSITYDQCFVNGTLLDGQLMIDMTNVVNGLILPTSFSSVFMLDLSITQNDTLYVFDGDFNLSYERANNVVDYQFAGTELSFSVESEVDSALEDFDIHYSVDGATSPEATELSISGVFLMSTVGVMSVETITSFSSTVGNYPTAGQIVIRSGRSESEGQTAVRLTAQSDGEQVEIEIDINGDGVYDTSSVQSWSEL